jgi:hypothetical protein
MKRILLTILAVVGTTIVLQAQVSFGFRGGANFAKQVTYSKQGSYAYPGVTRFHVAAYLEVPINSNFSFQPGVAFQQTGSKTITGVQDGEMLMDGWRKVQYIELPLNFLHYFSQNNFGQFFLGAGPYTSMAISGKQRFAYHTYKMSFGTDRNVDDMKKYDAGLNFLGGFKLTNGFFIHAGYGLGLLDIMLIDNARTYNRVFSAGVGYQL